MCDNSWPFLPLVPRGLLPFAPVPMGQGNNAGTFIWMSREHGSPGSISSHWHTCLWQDGQDIARRVDELSAWPQLCTWEVVCFCYQRSPPCKALLDFSNGLPVNSMVSIPCFSTNLSVSTITRGSSSSFRQLCCPGNTNLWLIYLSFRFFFSQTIFMLDILDTFHKIVICL